jgi:AcrR family transcriptional regulator
MKSSPRAAPHLQPQAGYSGTAARILDVAEGLFVELGVKATSLRLITQQAEVNLAAVNYHFRSKDALFEAVFARRFVPWARECLRELDTLEARIGAGRGTASVEDVVLCYVRPALSLSRDPARGGAVFARLVSRVLVENHRQLRDTLSRDWGHLVTRYTRALASALPQLSSEEVAWRLHLGFSVMFHAFAGNDILKVFGRSAVSARDPDRIVKHVVPFVVAGICSRLKSEKIADADAQRGENAAAPTTAGVPRPELMWTSGAPAPRKMAPGKLPEKRIAGRQGRG